MAGTFFPPTTDNTHLRVSRGKSQAIWRFFGSLHAIGHLAPEAGHCERFPARAVFGPWPLPGVK
jgi:hypothetical protein